MKDFVADYVADLRRRAAERRAEGLTQAAEQYELVARELEARRVAYEEEELSMQEAVEVTGYDESSIRRLRKAGVITMRRRDLPRRPGHGVQRGPERVEPGARGSLADELLQARARGAQATARARRDRRTPR